MRILITNDDGIHAEGLAVLERIARSISDDVWVVAPETDQSGVSHALTLSDPLRVRPISEKRFAVRGTPTDCVILAIHSLVLDKKFDLILSGVNRGENLADDVTYSGTVAGAMEGTLLGVKSIALSQGYGYENRELIHWETAEKFGANVVRQLLDKPTPEGTLWNVNFPPLPPEAIKGTQICSQGTRSDTQLKIESRNDGRGFPYFWIGFARSNQVLLEGTDLHAIENGYIALTPLHLDLTDRVTLNLHKN